MYKKFVYWQLDKKKMAAKGSSQGSSQVKGSSRQLRKTVILGTHGLKQSEKRALILYNIYKTCLKYS